MVWGANATDNADPVRVEKAFPAITTRAQLQRVGKHLSSRAPKFSHPRRVGSSYLLSGLAKCKTCNTPLIGRFAQSGKYSYYVCQSNIKLGKDACETPTLNARRFEELVVNKIRSNILTEGNIRDLVKGVAEEMDGVTREQRKRLETIEDELEEVKRKLGRIWQFIETSDAVMADASDRIREGFAPKVPVVPKVRVLFLKSPGFYVSRGFTLKVGVDAKVPRLMQKSARRPTFSPTLFGMRPRLRLD